MTEWAEAYISREGPTGQQIERDIIWVSFYEPDIEAARVELTSSVAPLFYDGGAGLLLPRRTVTPKMINDSTYSWTVNYGMDQNQVSVSDPDLGQFNTTLTFNLVGGTEHITSALSTVSYRLTADGPIIDVQKTIGIDLKTGQVRGVDILAPVLDYTLTTEFPNRIVTPAYVDALFDLTGTVNTASFKGRPAGSVLFKGARGSKKGSENWELAFEFAYSKNKTGLSIGGITGVDKKGWQYLEIMYRDSPTLLISGKPIQVPTQVNVHDVYENGDFSKMKIGVT